MVDLAFETIEGKPYVKEGEHRRKEVEHFDGILKDTGIDQRALSLSNHGANLIESGGSARLIYSKRSLGLRNINTNSTVPSGRYCQIGIFSFEKSYLLF